MQDQYIGQYIAQGIVAGRTHQGEDAAYRRELKQARAEARRERRRLRGF
ncbi:hypothetical protein ncot_08510 [Nocardioides sp. JQ2195]|nr:hypothetical protein [Nocardioides sp. JQ2195]QIX26643.1 hypothetical protein ncot_08510 [Nocardioides sp. JQ2195]